jgi:hypothetical protein
MVCVGRRSKQSSDLEGPLLRAVYLPLRIERSRPSLSLSCKVGASAFKQCPRAAMRVRRLHHQERGDQPADAGDRRQAPGDEAKLGPMAADRVHELRALARPAARAGPPASEPPVDRPFSPARSAFAAGLPPRTAPPRRPHCSCRAPHRAGRVGARSTAPRAQAASIHGPCPAPHASIATTVAGSLSKKGSTWARVNWRRSATCSLASTP